MADVPPSPDTTDELGDDTGTPRWVYVFGIILIALILVVVILHLAGGGFGGHAS